METATDGVFWDHPCLGPCPHCSHWASSGCSLGGSQVSLSGQRGSYCYSPAGCSAPSHLLQTKGPCRMLQLNRVQGVIAFSPFIWQMRKLRPQERKGCVQGHVVNPVFFSLACCPARRGEDPSTLDLTLRKWKNLDLKDSRLPWLSYGQAV